MASTIKVDQIQLSDGSTPTAADLGIGLTVDDMPAGSVVQVQRTLLQDSSAWSIATPNSTYKITDLSVTITPKYANSIFQVYVRMVGETNAAPHDFMTTLWRDNTRVNEGINADQRTMGITVGTLSHPTDNNSTPETYTFTTIDAPNTTSSVTYTAGFRSAVSGVTWYMNRTVGDGNSAAYKKTSSEIIVTEIKQ